VLVNVYARKPWNTFRGSMSSFPGCLGLYGKGILIHRINGYRIKTGFSDTLVIDKIYQAMRQHHACYPR